MLSILSDGIIACSWGYYVIYLGKGYGRSVGGGGDHIITILRGDKIEFYILGFLRIKQREHTQTHMNPYIGFSMHKIKIITIINN